ncbi:hypothetical protein EXN65_05625 [Clostridium botulinum]|uniref:hypothetical protein n=1 Tax=Clostridium botulinum TaxID=1491 RepID=UPI00016BB026|nr:hypothetical protein [Clostridium botulinum]EDT84442.1 hypothetical protein CBB_0982 [Clostridium botulinum Bf]MBY6882572.1 hypothetical protein [Clostridium botulinum]NEZ86192.1 hypothetical protein [Clostridium botulinum]NFB01209.1 hypothetical protein [Clostridium botulinum]NFE29980.1 hypothetical protein [Clostridium botulinum]
MQNELLNNIELRDKLANDISLFNTIGELSVLPKKVDIIGLSTIAEVAEFYKTKTEFITNILKEYIRS